MVAATHPHSYVVQEGDSLSGIAQRVYSDPGMWTGIWHANREIHDPNLIYPGQRLVLPSDSTAPHTIPNHIFRAAPQKVQPPRAQTPPHMQRSHHPAHYPLAHQVSLPGVPTVAKHFIVMAARHTGIPASVVASQNRVESSYGMNMGPSVTGAMGPWQFEPGTWPSYSSAPFSAATDWNASTHAYINYMSQLMHWSGGNVRMALAAYNAGQGNWGAGLGYADTILSGS